MRSALILLALVPLVFSYPEKRLFLDTFGLDLNLIKATVQHVLDTLGTDATEQQCEGVCHGFVKGDDGALLHTFCTPVCRSVQSLTHVFHLTPSVTSAPARRSIFDQLVDIKAVRDTVAKLADTLGTDATEQQCEASCHAIVLGEETALAHTLCNPVCKSFQALSHHFGHHQAKRFFLDSVGLDLGSIKSTVQHVLDTLGTDATEQQCEGVCHGFVKGDDGALLHTFCTPVCRSMQSLTHVFNLTPAVTAPARRSIFDQLVDIKAVRDTVAKLADTLGTDATEQQCEASCHAIVLGEETALAHTLCTPVCKSFQALSHHFGHHQAKRFFLDSVGLDLGSIKSTVQHVLDTLGTDATEQQCEGVCHGFVKGDDGALLHTFCTPVCRSMQSLTHVFNLTPAVTAPARRSIFDQLVDIQAVKDTVASLVDTLGTDATEQQCEAGCHALVLGEETALAHTLCTPVCKSFQALSNHFGHHQAKRFFLDTFGVDLNLIKATVQHVLDTLGTDATEQQCEGVCHGFVKGDDGALLHTFCTPVCRSVQSLTHVFHLTPAVTAPARRSIFDQLVDIQAVKDTVAKLADTLGTDATEQQCEASCHAIVLGEETALAHTLCNPVCKSFQALSHHFGHHQAKRFFLNDLIDLSVVKDTVGKLFTTLGTDANEQQCESSCHALVLGEETALAHTLCTPVCRSFQALTHRFGFQTPTAAPVKKSVDKRFFLDSIGLDLGSIKDTVQHLVDNLATDANEQQCESVCHGFVKGDDGALLHTFCTPVCKSFQSLVHMFNISPNHIVASKAATV